MVRVWRRRLRRGLTGSRSMVYHALATAVVVVIEYYHGKEVGMRVSYKDGLAWPNHHKKYLTKKDGGTGVRVNSVPQQQTRAHTCPFQFPDTATRRLSEVSTHSHMAVSSARLPFRSSVYCWL